ncbi:MAG: UDP-2,4-diacetamido-2,4,6-trideoxy-beta-L-altropyranose hydrolase [Rhodospirillales bacterium]|nr:UDP-2,4-diacetamido-2,4,6-trideoxy-beta-L-altropyranose hydrolase [Rhodospirillales bacterium]
MDGESVYFRCDASRAIGSGHVMRCLTLADALSEQGWGCYFIVSEETVKIVPALSAFGHHIHNVSYSPKKADLLIVDHYGLDARYETQARAWAEHILVLDDLADRQHDCDLLLDQTYGRQAEDYKALVPDHCEVLTGCAYALLRPQFHEYRQQSLERRKDLSAVKRVLVSMGSTNIHDVTSKVLEGLALYNGGPLEIDVVLGSDAFAFENVEELVCRLNVETPHMAHLHKAVENMAEMMSQADIAFGCGGTTSWERCALGLPSLLITVADNQNFITSMLKKAGACIHLGRHDQVSAEDIACSIGRLHDAPAECAALSRSSSALCDGLGARRTVENIVSLL